MQDVGGESVNTANAFLGDRPNVTNLAINGDGSITVDMIQVGPNDAFCCANMPMTVTYVKAGDQLVMRDQASATIDTTGYEGQVTAAVVQPTPYDNTMPPSGQGEPKHFTWTLGDATEPGSVTGYVSVYPVEAYQAIWDVEGDPFVSDTLAQLETLLSEQPADPAPPMPVLPQLARPMTSPRRWRISTCPAAAAACASSAASCKMSRPSRTSSCAMSSRG